MPFSQKRHSNGFRALVPPCAGSDLATSRTQLMLTTNQNTASSTPTAPNNDRANDRNGCRYSPIGMSVGGSHCKNINRPQQCGYARCPINRISQTSHHGSLHRLRLPGPAIRCSIVQDCAMEEIGELSNELLVKTNPLDFSDCRSRFSNSPAEKLGLLRQHAIPLCQRNFHIENIHNSTPNSH